MQRFARIIDGLVVETFDMPKTFDELDTEASSEGGFTYKSRPAVIGDFFPEDVASQFEPVADGVEQGWTKKGKGYVAPEPFMPPPVTWDYLRPERDRLLKDSDWAMLPDAPLTDAQVKKWKSYRQELRGLPEAQPDASKVTWPKLPR